MIFSRSGQGRATNASWHLICGGRERARREQPVHCLSAGTMLSSQRLKAKLQLKGKHRPEIMVKKKEFLG